MTGYYKIIKVTEISEENLYEEILGLVLDGDTKGLKDTLKQFKDVKLDLSYRDGLLGTLAAQSDDPTLLHLLCEYDNELLNKHGVEMLGSAINHDKIDCIKLLLDSGVKVEELKNTTSYGYYQDIKNLVETTPNYTEIKSGYLSDLSDLSDSPKLAGNHSNSNSEPDICVN